MASGIQTGSTSLASTVLTLFHNYSENRKSTEHSWEKSRSNFQGVLTEQWKKNQGTGWRARSFINVTKSKVISAYAIIVDLMLQGGKIAFALVPSGFDDITFDELPDDLRTQIEENIQDHEDLISQQLDDVKADRAFMKNVMAAAMLGETYAKKTVVDVQRKGQRQVQLPGIADQGSIPPELLQFEQFVETRTSMGWEYRPNWNIYRDMEMEDMQLGQGVFDADFDSPFSLAQNKDKIGWINTAIDAAIRENPAKGTVGRSSSSAGENNTSSLVPRLRNLKNRQRNIRRLEYYGRLQREEVERFEEVLAQGLGGDDLPSLAKFGANVDQDTGDEVEVMVIVAGQHVVFYLRTEPGKRPFERAVWDQNLDELAGTGVADNAKPLQDIINGVFNDAQDNLKWSSNVQLAGKARGFADGIPKYVEPGKFIELDETVSKASDAMEQIIIQDVTGGLFNLLSTADQYLDVVSLLSKPTQGVREGGSQQTAFEISRRLEQSGKYTGQVIKNFDEGLVEPMITSYYDRNMDDPDLEIPKGSYIVKPLGFTSFNDRVVRITKLQAFMAMIINDPELRARYKIGEISDEIGKALDVDIDDVKKPKEEREAEEEAQQQAANEAAQLAAAEQEADIAKTSADAQAAVIKAETELEQTKNDKVRLIADIEEKQRTAKNNELEPIEELRARMQP